MSTLREQHIWLISTIERHGRISFRELARKWEDSPHVNPDSKPLSLRTFHRMKEEIRDTYGIDIACDRHDGYRYWLNGYDRESRDSLTAWMFDTLAADSLLSSSKDLRDRIQVEAIPSGQRFLDILIRAMQDSRRLRVTYRRFNSDADDRTMLLSPYFIKLSKQRWYVIGESDSHPGQIRIYALDRIVEVAVTDIGFSYPDTFNPYAYFMYSYGVFHNESVPDPVLLRVSASHRNYVRSLPLHHSQKEIETNDEYSVFTLRIHPDIDFINEVLSHGDFMEIIGPEPLRRKVGELLERAAAKYR